MGLRQIQISQTEVKIFFPTSKSLTIYIRAIQEDYLGYYREGLKITKVYKTFALNKPGFLLKTSTGESKFLTKKEFYEWMIGKWLVKNLQ